MSKSKTICVYCGSAVGARSEYRSIANELGTAMAEADFRLVYGGAHVGLMGVIADAVLAAGGEVIGIIPQQLADREVAHRGLTELHVVRTMHERKHMMAELADAFVAMPGGYGTLDELCEVLGWASLAIHEKPIILLDTAEYWQPLFAMLDRAVEEGFLQTHHRRHAMRAADVADVFKLLRAERPVPR
ncbi:MAG TPA: TIGR00730 family Rossman fold protein [Acidobacteriaceae bacterium]